MTFNVADFASNIARYGTLQTNKFEVTFFERIIEQNTTTITKIISNANLTEDESISFVNGGLIHKERIDSVKLPGSTIDTYESRRYGVGPNIKVGTNVRMEPFSISVITDKNYNLYKFFYTWVNSVFDFSGSAVGNRLPTYLTNYKDEYSMRTEVRVFENTGLLKAKYIFFDSFPIGITEPSLSWRDNNNLLKFDVTFAYTNWQISNQNTQAIAP
jgi:hypothetical protein